MPPTSTVGLRPEYHVDAGRSNAIDDALQPVLAEIRMLLGADIGLVVYRPDTPGADVLVLAASARDPGDLPLPNEPLVLGRPVPRRSPRVLVDLEIVSALRPYRLLLRSAVAIPWTDAFGAGAVVVGTTSPQPLPRTAEPEMQARCSRAVGAALRRGRRAGALRINADLQRAVREVAEAAVTSDDVAAALASMLVSVRDLFGSEVAYLSLPEHDVDTFTFDQVLGIRTAEFRHLRIRLGQGLGGLARSLQRPVRSLDYAGDGRLYAAPVAETVREGIVSAMAAPVLVEDEIKAVLYIGNRRLRPFTDLDEDLLGEFAGYATLGLKRRAVEDYRVRMIQRQERERLAFDVHDSVVRGLVEIGFAAEEGRLTATDPALRSRLATIGLAAEQCMEKLRGQLVLLTEDRDGPVGPRASEVLDRVAAAGRRAGVTRSFELRGPDTLLAGPIADALVRIGREALVNAEIHSGCRRASICLEMTATDAVLTVSDDGCGLDAAALDEVLAGAATHLGFRAMRAAAERARGHVCVEPGTAGGLTVRAVIPHDARPEPA